VVSEEDGSQYFSTRSKPKNEEEETASVSSSRPDSLSTSTRSRTTTSNQQTRQQTWLKTFYQARRNSLNNFQQQQQQQQQSPTSTSNQQSRRSKRRNPHWPSIHTNSTHSEPDNLQIRSFYGDEDDLRTSWRIALTASQHRDIQNSASDNSNSNSNSHQDLHHRRHNARRNVGRSSNRSSDLFGSFYEEQDDEYTNDLASEADQTSRTESTRDDSSLPANNAETSNVEWMMKNIQRLEQQLSMSNSGSLDQEHIDDDDSSRAAVLSKGLFPRRGSSSNPPDLQPLSQHSIDDSSVISLTTEDLMFSDNHVEEEFARQEQLGRDANHHSSMPSFDRKDLELLASPQQKRRPRRHSMEYRSNGYYKTRGAGNHNNTSYSSLVFSFFGGDEPMGNVSTETLTPPTHQASTTKKEAIAIANNNSQSRRTERKRGRMIYSLFGDNSHEVLPSAPDFADVTITINYDNPPQYASNGRIMRRASSSFVSSSSTTGSNGDPEGGGAAKHRLRSRRASLSLLSTSTISSHHSDDPLQRMANEERRASMRSRRSSFLSSTSTISSHDVEPAIPKLRKAAVEATSNNNKPSSIPHHYPQYPPPRRTVRRGGRRQRPNSIDNASTGNNVNSPKNDMDDINFDSTHAINSIRTTSNSSSSDEGINFDSTHAIATVARSMDGCGRRD